MQTRGHPSFGNTQEKKKNHSPFTKNNHHSFSRFNARHPCWGPVVPALPRALISDNLSRFTADVRKQSLELFIFAHIFLIRLSSQRKPDVLWRVRNQSGGRESRGRVSLLRPLNPVKRPRPRCRTKCCFLAICLKGTSWKSPYLVVLKTGQNKKTAGRAWVRRVCSRSPWGGGKGCEGRCPVQGRIHAAAPTCNPLTGSVIVRSGCVPRRVPARTCPQHPTAGLPEVSSSVLGAHHRYEGAHAGSSQAAGPPGS